ncbi:translesion error-prone DNA polymerase V autoproteolytic subunit [Maridesulfovibrio sp.]|uniref:LexA family protein n=1 Tax=Maridesulfovibrio sp. TaxID=2795000 RepID=UPI002A18E78D|nr:translesion error-prone DNA polymerase V autoproteolytic subunit [Maridesulfovibrio sp.]
MSHNTTQILIPDSKGRTEFPLMLSQVAAGFPSPAEDYIERKMDLNEYLVKNTAATFFVRCCGDSMRDANILSGDILIVDRSLDAANNSIIIAAVNGELTVKRIRAAKDGIYLVPENPEYQPLEITTDTSFEIWGVVTYIIHKAAK